MTRTDRDSTNRYRARERTHVHTAERALITGVCIRSATQWNLGWSISMNCYPTLGDPDCPLDSSKTINKNTEMNDQYWSLNNLLKLIISNNQDGINSSWLMLAIIILPGIVTQLPWLRRGAVQVRLRSVCFNSWAGRLVDKNSARMRKCR